MIPVVTPEEMRAVDRAAPEPLDELVRRAGAAVARQALTMLGGAYGRVVHVIAGRGNNGADGREAARRLRQRGVRVVVHDVASCPAALPTCDLVIDAAFGTGYAPRPGSAWTPPRIGATRVLAVDVPSGLDALTGTASGDVLAAEVTVTFQAFKPGLLFGEGPALAGKVRVVDIGLDVSVSRCRIVGAADVGAWWPQRRVDAHKWLGAVKVIAGSASMPGAAELCVAAAARAGSGLISLSAPGCVPSTRSEVVQHHVPATGFADEAMRDIDRFSALVIGPGLGRDDGVMHSTRACVDRADLAIVIDGDALTAVKDLAWIGGMSVMTPHDGEFKTLTGAPPGPDRIADTRAAAESMRTTVLLKGPTTVIAGPDGEVLLVDRGDQRLATAGSGDVLAGLIGAALAGGLDPLRAAAASAWIHADASRRRPSVGLLAGDLIDALPETIESLP